MEDLLKRTRAEISLDNIEYNYRLIRSRIPAACKFLGVVKANAYGHGAVPVAKRLEQAGADYLAVACLSEAIELREAGLTLPILILGYTPAEFTESLIRYQITQATPSLEAARAYSAACTRLGGTLKIHIKADTGMSRFGFLCDEESLAASVEEAAEACALPGLEPEGIFTHLCVSDTEGEDNERYTRLQFRRFMSLISALEQKGRRFAIRHCANTGAVQCYPEMALDMVRPGILLYGYGDLISLGVRPCMRLVSHIASVKTFPAGTDIGYGRTYKTERESRIGVIPCGYADGLHRILSNQVQFFTEGQPVPQRGRICMDLSMIDITDIPAAQVGTEVEIFGPNCSLDALCDIARTIPYELLCAVAPRVPRVY